MRRTGTRWSRHLGLSALAHTGLSGLALTGVAAAVTFPAWYMLGALVFGQPGQGQR
jgi:hypothetical protein